MLKKVIFLAIERKQGQGHICIILIHSTCTFYYVSLGEKWNFYCTAKTFHDQLLRTYNLDMHVMYVCLSCCRNQGQGRRDQTLNDFKAEMAGVLIVII